MRGIVGWIFRLGMMGWIGGDETPDEYWGRTSKKKQPAVVSCKIDQARSDRQLEIGRLQMEIRRAEVQPGSELLVESYRKRIQTLERRNADGVIYANRRWPSLHTW